MSTASLFVVVAIAWSTVGFVVALFLGRLLRQANPTAEERIHRLVC